MKDSTQLLSVETILNSAIVNPAAKGCCPDKVSVGQDGYGWVPLDLPLVYSFHPHNEHEYS